jgi:hypothetical protein
MAQKKGQTGNVNGRPKGTPNRVSTELRKWVSNLIDENREQIKKDLMSVEPEKRLAMLEKLMQYVLPKPQQKIEVDKDDDFNKRFIEALQLKK